MSKTESEVIEKADIDFDEWKNRHQKQVPETGQEPLPANDRDMSKPVAPDPQTGEQSEGKALSDSAKASLNGLEVAISTREAELANLKDGDKHEAVFEALRDVVFFAIWAMGNPDEARDSFNEWEQHKPERTNTNPYAQPVNMMFANAGVSLDSIKAKRCEWAKIAEYVHPIAKRGGVTEDNFIKLVKSHGGIHAVYKRATQSGKKPPGRKSGGGKGMSGADADAKIEADLENLRQAKKASAPHLVAVFFDISKSDAYKSAESLGKFLSRMEEYVEAFNVAEGDIEIFRMEEAANEPDKSDADLGGGYE